ncbi:MAG: hypothetical protein IPP94_02450 [Ignavibacteria bacterium]|nr:hypothetical protein [Ignavibacteria bacterium]
MKHTCLLLAALLVHILSSLTQAQIDTATVGWRDRPNSFLEENAFTKPIRRLPTPIPQNSQTYEVMTWKVTDSSNIWGLNVLHSVPGLNDDGFHSESMMLGYNNSGTYGNGTGKWGMWLKMENYFNHGYSAPPRGPIMETHFEYLGENKEQRRSWTAYNATADARGTHHEVGYDYIGFSNGSGVSPNSIDSVAMVIKPPRSIGANFQFGEVNLYKSILTHSTNNTVFLRQWSAPDSLAQIQMMRLDAQNNAIYGWKSPITEWTNAPRKATLAARQVYIEADAFQSKIGFFANKFHFGIPFSGIDSTLQVAGGAHLSGGLRMASSFGKDSLTAATNWYVEGRVSATIADAYEAISDSLDANARDYMRTSGLTDSLNAIPRQKGLSTSELRDTLDVNARQYVRMTGLTDSLDAMPRQAGISAVQLRDSLDANARQYVRTSGLTDSLNAMPRQAGISAAQLRDSLDVNARQYIRTSGLTDSLNAIPRQAGISATQLRDSLDANARQYVRTSGLSDSLNAMPRQAGVSASQLRDSLDVNARQYVRLSGLSDSLNTMPRQPGVSRMQLSDSLDANARQYLRSSTLTDSLDAMPRHAGVTPAQLADSLDANARSYVSRSELADTLDANARQRVSLDVLTDSLDANSRLAIRSTQGLVSADIDWSSAEVFADTLNSATNYTFTNMIDGKTIVVAITNPSSYTVTWPAAVKWPYSRTPVQSGANRTDIWTFIKVNAIVYGTVVQNF